MNITTRISASILAVAVAGCATQNHTLPTYEMAPNQVVPNSSSSVTGVVLEYGSPKPIANATVVIGTIPVLDPCDDCGHPIAPLHAAHTDATGRFSVKGMKAGTWFLQVAKPGYATLHAQIVVGSGAANLGTRRIVRLRPDEIQFIRVLNLYRRRLAKPRTSGNISIDEYALEYARTFENDIQRKKRKYGDPMYTAPKDAVPLGAGGVEAGSQPTAKNSLEAYFSERKNCPHDSWAKCKYGETTGHYIQLANSNTMWVGPARSVKPSYVGPTGFKVYDFGAVVLGGWDAKP